MYHVRISVQIISNFFVAPIPWTAFEDDEVHFWVHYSFVILGFILAVISTISQWKKPAPYGKHDPEKNNQSSGWGPMIPQRIGHVISDAIPGVLLFMLVFFLYGEERAAVNICFPILFELHYIHRGIIHPFFMRYSSKKVPIGITIGGLIPNCIFHFINADWIGSAKYDGNYYYDPRFLLGLILFLTGYIINRWADFKLRGLRTKRLVHEEGNESSNGYSIPYGGLFNLVACPNYLGEFIEWLGWSLATWSLAGVVWLLFSSSTFFPRARHNLKWYQDNFEDYPKNRKAMIPYIF